MQSMALICSHLVGDFLFQTDWMACVKVAQPPKGSRPELPPGGLFLSLKEYELQAKWDRELKYYRQAWFACTVHCVFYTLSCLLLCFWFLTWWSYIVIFLTHWPIDRWRLASVFMRISGKNGFSEPPFAPWGTIIVDQCFHLLVLYILGVASMI